MQLVTRLVRGAAILGFLSLLVNPAGGAPVAGDEPVSYGEDIRPIFSDKCFTCHGPDDGERKTKFRLDEEDGAFIELASGGQAIVRGKPEESELLQRLISEDPIRRMPPGYMGHDPLEAKEIDLIRRWIEQGAEWEGHWAFTPLRRPAQPAVNDTAWSRNGLDYFVLSRLEKEGLQPSPEADKRTLIRRLSLDLTGVPPAPQEVRAFVDDTSENAYETLVDRLLASRRYGERMAIRWLDASRYADTNGYQSDGYRDMYRWRDWVIDAFNDNKPFDEFTIEQLAGDMLPSATRDQVIASGFNRNHRTTAEGGIVEEEFRVEYVADRLETTSTVWLGLTVGCARCHDHKYDPITQKEFYQLFAYFNNMDERGLVYNFGNEHPFIKAPTPEQEERLAELDRLVAKNKDAYESLRKELKRSQRGWEAWASQSGMPDWTPHEGLLLHFKMDGNTEEATGAYTYVPSRYDPEPAPPPPPTSFVEAKEGDTTFTEGKWGQAATFDGERFMYGGSGFKFNYLDPFTFSAWVLPTSPDGAILSQGDDFSKGTGHGLYLRDGKVFLYVTARWTDISMRLQTEKQVALNEWQHITVTYDGKRWAKGVHIYINGEEWSKDVLFDELNFTFGTPEPLRIGSGGGEPRFQGSLDDLRIYDRALSRDEVLALWSLDTVPEIAAIPPGKRSEAQATKIRQAFLDQAAPKEIQTALAEWRGAQHERTQFYESIPTVMVMKERAERRQTHVLRRGAYDAPGDPVEPAVPAVLGKLPKGYPNNRLGLARWLVHPSNPLPARVTVNRFWQMLFGIGLVKTAENFGSQGEQPVHRDLLNWLSSEFIDSGWDIKHLMKTIAMSATYRQSSKVTDELVERDPENRLFARAPRYRLSAEVVRDQALAASGLLVEKVGGPSVKPYQPDGLWKELTFAAGYKRGAGDDLYRRSLYTFWRRTVAPPSMVTFDSTDRENCSVLETRTNTPLQALNLMNDVSYVEASRKMAERMMTEGGQSRADRIAYGFELVTARPPESSEQEVLAGVHQHFLENFEADPDTVTGLLEQGESEIDADLDPGELGAYTTVASLILNLDEAITRE